MPSGGFWLIAAALAIRPYFQAATADHEGSGTSFGVTGALQSAPRAMVCSVAAMDFSISRARLLVSEVIRHPVFRHDLPDIAEAAGGDDPVQEGAGLRHLPFPDTNCAVRSRRKNHVLGRVKPGVP